MKKIEGQALRRRRAIGGGIAGATAAAVILAGAIAPNMATAAPSDKSEALGQIIASELLGADLLTAASSSSGYPSEAGPDVNPLNLELLGALSVDLGGGLTLPLVSSPGGAGLLDLGQVGALHSFASSPSATVSTASAGAVTEDGTIALDPENPGDFGPATVNLTDVLDQLGLSGVTDAVVDNLSLEVGAAASTATSTADVPSSQYVLAGAEFNLSSPLVAGISGALDGVLSGVGTTLNTAVGTDGVLGAAVSALSLDLNAGLVAIEIGGGTIAIDGLPAAIAAAKTTLLATPLTDANGIVSIDLNNGLVTIDLEKVVDGGSLNGLDPNTLLLDDTTINRITDAVAEALSALSTRVVTVVTDLINNLDVTIALGAEVSALGLPAAQVDVLVKAKLGQLTGAVDGDPVVSVEGDLLGIIPVGSLLTAITTPVINLVTGALSPVVGTVLNTVTTGLPGAVDAITDPVLTGLSPVLDALNEVVEITINEQPGGYLGAESFTVNAISLELLPNAAAVNLDLASSTVRSTAVAAPAIDAAPTVAAGSNLPVTGTGWPADTDVTLQLTAPAGGGNVGTAVTVTTNASGELTGGYPVPAGTAPGAGYTLTATAGDLSATDTTEVTAGGTGDVNVNAAASASASADATADGDPAAQVAAQAAALANNETDASAAATADAEAAAEVAATADASNEASATSTTDVNAQAAAAAQAAADADANDDVNAAASTAANANSSASSEAAATADSSNEASAEASTNANAAASATASANADASTAAVAEAAAQAAAYAEADSDATAAATANAQAAAQAAATTTASTAATADATSAANANAAIAAQAAALADATSNTAADTSATADSSSSAASNAAAAAIANASTDASTTAVADATADADPTATATTTATSTATTTATSTATATADPTAAATATADPTASATATTAADAEVNTNATASAAASAQADNDNNAAAVAAAVAAALANADDDASAAATANANAAAAAAATATATATASTDATSETNARAAAAAQVAAQADATSNTNADTTAQANANASAAASAAATADSSNQASADAAADVDATATATTSATATATTSATATASANADAAANPTGKLGITVKHPMLERGDTQTAIGTGFKPGEVVTGVMNSDPLALGTQVANAQGTVTFTWKIPAGTDLGTHTVTLTGAESGSVAGTFKVVADGLATTGADAPFGWIGLGALLLMLGLGTAIVARRRAVNAAE